MQLGDEAHVIASARIDRNHRFGTDLKIFPRPDDAWIDCASRLAACTPVQRSFQCELHGRNQPIDRCWQMHVLHLRLQINHTVFQRKTPLQHVGMPLDLNLAFARLVIDHDTARARTCWNRHACCAGESERLEEPQSVGQIPKAFTEKKSPASKC